MKKNRNSKYLFQLFTLAFTVLIFKSGLAQTTEGKRYTSDLDRFWSISTNVINYSPDGDWIVIREVYNNEKSILFLSDTRGGFLKQLESSAELKFSNDSKWLACLSFEMELSLIDLRSQDVRSFHNVKSFDFSNDGRYISISSINQEETESLLILGLQEKTKTIFENIKYYQWNPIKSVLTIYQNSRNENAIRLFDAIKKDKKEIIKNKNAQYSQFAWNASGNNLVFLEKVNGEKRIYFTNLQGEKQILTNNKLKNFFPDGYISDKEVKVSNSGDRVFFFREFVKDNKPEGGTVEVWNTSDPWIYPKLKRYNERELSSLLTIWQPGTDLIHIVADDETPSVRYNPNHAHAIVYNKISKEPRYKESVDADLFLKDFESGSKHLVVKDVYDFERFFNFSPTGRFFVFYKDHNWWLYDSYKDSRINLTEGIENSFIETNFYWTKDGTPIDSPAWSTDERYVILTDENDIWLIETEGTEKRRITSGKEKGISYAILHDNSKYLESIFELTGFSYNLEKGLLLTMSGEDLQTGYSFWSEGNKIRELVYGPYRTAEGVLSNNKKTLVYQRSRFNQPFAIYANNINQNRNKLLYQSNKQLVEYDLGADEIIYYSTQNGQLFKGVLIYPANYISSKRYPMITWVYENNTVMRNRYSSPSDFEAIGFNILKYVTDGYFIFLPDLYYEVGKPGESATTSLKLAIQEVLKNPSIDEKRLGLIGHSWGGYEVTFIVTQSDLFAVAVAGAATTDFVSHYHSVWWGFDDGQFWRYESQQFRMGDSYYNMKEQYYKNSPLYHVEDLNTPLLLWTGKEDNNINWSQGLYFHQAMRRLKKPGKLLLFPNEGHFLLKKDNQARLSKELSEWFKQYLKN